PFHGLDGAPNLTWGSAFGSTPGFTLPPAPRARIIPKNLIYRVLITVLTKYSSALIHRRGRRRNAEGKRLTLSSARLRRPLRLNRRLVTLLTLYLVITKDGFKLSCVKPSLFSYPSSPFHFGSFQHPPAARSSG